MIRPWAEILNSIKHFPGWWNVKLKFTYSTLIYVWVYRYCTPNMSIMNNETVHEIYMYTCFAIRFDCTVLMNWWIRAIVLFHFPHIDQIIKSPSIIYCSIYYTCTLEKKRLYILGCKEPLRNHFFWTAKMFNIDF